MKNARLFLGVAVLTLVMLAPAVMAQRRGGAASSGVRGAMVGGLVGGEGAAKKGAAIGAVAGATRTVTQSAQQRSAVNAEAQARAQYTSTEQYQNAQHSNFNEAPPEVLDDSSPEGSPGNASAPKAGKPAASGASKKDDKPVETVISKAGKPALGITYPPDWKQTAKHRRVTAVNPDGNAWSVITLLEGVKDKQAGITKAKQGLEKSLEEIEYDEPTETERGALVVTGTGKGKKAGVEVVFAIGVFESGAGQISGAAFIVDQDVEDHYKVIVKQICQTIRGEKDFAEKKENAK